MMNPKLFFGLLFGFPTVLLACLYYSLGINNLWQLFIFGCAAILGYMPGIIMLHMFYRNRIQKTLVDFVYARTN